WQPCATRVIPRITRMATRCGSSSWSRILAAKVPLARSVREPASRSASKPSPRRPNEPPAGAGGSDSAIAGPVPENRARPRTPSEAVSAPFSAPAADLVDVLQEVRRILVDAVSAGPHELVLPVASGEEPDTGRAGAPRREHVPHAVADDARALDGLPKQLCGREKQVWVRLRVLDHVAGDDRRASGIDAEHRQDGSRGFDAAARRDCPRNACIGQVIEQLAGPRQRTDLTGTAQVRFAVGLDQPLDAVRLNLDPGLAQQHVREQAARHADLAVYAPDGQVDAVAAQRLAPREHMLVHAVDQRAVEIEDEGGLARGHAGSLAQPPAQSRSAVSASSERSASGM